MKSLDEAGAYLKTVLRMRSKAANHLICAFLRRCLRQMKRLGMNQTDLAKRMQVSRPYITKLMSGDVNITFETALRLAKAVKMDFMPQLRDKETKEIAADDETPVPLAIGV